MISWSCNAPMISAASGGTIPIRGSRPTSHSCVFEPYAEWSRGYAPGAEVKGYADHCARKYGHTAKWGHTYAPDYVAASQT